MALSFGGLTEPKLLKSKANDKNLGATKSQVDVNDNLIHVNFTDYTKIPIQIDDSTENEVIYFWASCADSYYDFSIGNGRYNEGSDIAVAHIHDPRGGATISTGNLISSVNANNALRNSIYKNRYDHGSIATGNAASVGWSGLSLGSPSICVTTIEISGNLKFSVGAYCQGFNASSYTIDVWNNSGTTYNVYSNTLIL